MGCDIHMYAEFKVNNGEWKPHDEHIKKLNKLSIQYEKKGASSHIPPMLEIDAVCRDYDLFGRLAGVRRQNMKVTPKGTPEDISELVKDAIKYWGIDGHSHSWLTLSEFKDVLFSDGFYSETDRTDMFYDCEELGFYGAPPAFTTVVKSCEKYIEEKTVDSILLDEELPEIQCRLVFWFDN
jgi:hypothetical protein